MSHLREIGRLCLPEAASPKEERGAAGGGAEGPRSGPAGPAGRAGPGWVGPGHPGEEPTSVEASRQANSQLVPV